MLDDFDIQKCKQTIAIMEFLKEQVKQSVESIKKHTDITVSNETSEQYLLGIEDGANLATIIAQNMIDVASTAIIKEGEKYVRKNDDKHNIKS